LREEVDVYPDWEPTLVERAILRRSCAQDPARLAELVIVESFCFGIVTGGGSRAEKVCVVASVFTIHAVG